MQAAYYALHYGREYLAWSIRSIQDAVDQIHIFYVDKPSYGHGGKATCPDTREQLVAEANRFATKPIHWHDCGSFPGEGAHRDHAVQTLKRLGAHQILVVDADEIWPDGEAKRAIYEATLANRARNWGAPFVHFYRSVHFVLRDHFLPIRVIDLRHRVGDATLTTDPVLHFGYAQRVELMHYKWTCHGHQDELRAGWMEKFVGWDPDCRDLHPVVIDLWQQAQHVDDALQEQIAKVLHGHPYLELLKIP